MTAKVHKIVLAKTVNLLVQFQLFSKKHKSSHVIFLVKIPNLLINFFF